MTVYCFGCDTKIDVTAAIWVYDSPYCLTCYMASTREESDEKIAESHNTSPVVGVAR